MDRCKTVPGTEFTCDCDECTEIRREAFAEAAKYARSMKTGSRVLNESYINGYNDACKDLAGEYEARAKGE